MLELILLLLSALGCGDPENAPAPQVGPEFIPDG